MSKKKTIAIICIAVVAIFAVSLSIKVAEYSNTINNSPNKLNLTKVKEHLDKGGSLDDPVTPDMKIK